MWAAGSRPPVALGLLAGTILAAFMAITCHADEPPSALTATGRANALTVASAVGCGTKPIGKLIVATLSRAPIVTLSANGHSVTLILDTGAERTVLTPAVAERIGAQRPAIEFQRRMHGIAGDLATHEVELRSFAAGGIAIPWRRVLVAPVTLTRVFPTSLDGLLGADVLSDFDIDLDLPRHELSFYQKQSSPAAAPPPDNALRTLSEADPIRPPSCVARSNSSRFTNADAGR